MPPKQCCINAVLRSAITGRLAVCTCPCHRQPLPPLCCGCQRVLSDGRLVYCHRCLPDAMLNQREAYV